MFAISDIDPSIGRVRLDQVSHLDGKKRKVIKPLQMVDCRELLKEENGSNNDQFDIEKILNRFDNNFLCPKDINEMTLQGNYGDDIFKFIKITVDGCQLS